LGSKPCSGEGKGETALSANKAAVVYRWPSQVQFAWILRNWLPGIPGRSAVVPKVIASRPFETSAVV
jgi:hypothetical protein